MNQIEFAGQSNQGSRSHNEDHYFLPDTINQKLLQSKGYLFIVADGVGGHEAGEVASQKAVQIVSETYYKDTNANVNESLKMAISKANNKIFQQAKQAKKERGMATTITAAVLKGSSLTVANVGDSRTYLFHNGQLEQLSRDHTWVAQQQEAGIITAEQAKNHPQKNVVTRSLGHKLEVEIDVFPAQTVSPAHSIILCSDGLPAVVDDSDIRQIMSSGRPAKDIAKKLVSLTLERGAPDNVTTIVAHFGPRPTGSGSVPVRSGSVAMGAGSGSMSPQQVAQGQQANRSPTHPPTPPPATPQKTTSSKLPLIIGGVIALLILLGGLAAGLLFLLTGDSETAQAPTNQPVAAVVDTPTPLPGEPTLAPAIPTPEAPVITTTTTPLTSPTSLSPTMTTELSPTDQLPASPPPEAAGEAQTLTVVAPPEGSRQDQDDPITLRWTGRQLADNERFAIVMRNNDRQEVFPAQGTDKWTTTTESFPVEKRLPPGDYTWLVLVEAEQDGQYKEVNRAAGKFTILAPASAQLPPTPVATEEAATDLTADIDLSNLTLIPPLSNPVFSHQDATFQWRWPGELPPGYQFELRIWLGNETHYGAYDVKDVPVQRNGDTYSVTFKPEGALSVFEHGTRENYQWAVAVVKIDPDYQRIEGLESASQKINISLPGSSGGGGGGSSGGGEGGDAGTR